MKKYKQLLQKILAYRLHEPSEHNVIVTDYLFGVDYVTVYYKIWNKSDRIDIPNSEILAHIVENM